MVLKPWRHALTGLMLLVWPLAAEAADSEHCPAAKVAPMPVPHLRRALTQNQDVTVVALGSSSTAGTRASDVAHSYPAVLQEQLEAALPSSHIAVLNRGIGGQDAAEELARLDHDVIALQPTLVIWQVGANGAMKGVDPDVFKRLVGSGVHRLEAAGIDVILMDNQRSPAILASAQHVRIDQALSEVAGKHRAALFGRGRLMDLWQQDGEPYANFLSDDGVHHNDRGYACVAKALATSIVQGLGPDPTSQKVQSAAVH